VNLIYHRRCVVPITLQCDNYLLLPSSPLTDAIPHGGAGYVASGGCGFGVPAERRTDLQQRGDTASAEYLSHPQGCHHTEGPRRHRIGRLRIDPRGPKDQSLRDSGRTRATRSGQQSPVPD